MKKIIFIGFKQLNREPRGVESVIYSQISAIRNKYDRIYYIYYGLGVGKFDRIVNIGIGKNFFCATKKILSLTKKGFFNECFIWSHNVALSIFLRNINILTVHDLFSRTNKALFKAYIFKKIENLVFKKTIKIHCVSKFSSTVLSSFHPETSDKTSIIYNSSKFEITSPVNKKSSERIPIINKNYFLSVRSLESRANLYWLIDVFELYHKHAKDLSLYIVGTGPLLKELSYYIEQKNLKNRIILTGYMPDYQLKELYKNAKLVIVSALSDEGFGLPVIEAYMFGIPVFVNNVDALPEIIYSKKYILSDDMLKASTQLLRYQNNGEDFEKYYHENFSKVKIEGQYKDLHG